MELYKILLVDDEEEIRKGIIRTMDWERLGFCLAGDAENGQDALEKVSQLDPDLLLTDIKMPYMDGLELARRVKQERDSVEFVFFSGFDEFEYAQKAIALEAMEYLLKPVDRDELEQVLIKVKKRMDERIAQARDLSMLRESYRRTLPVLREYFLNDLTHGNLTEREIREGFARYELPVNGAREWCMVSCEIQTPGLQDMMPLHRETGLLSVSVSRLVEERLKGQYLFTMFLRGEGQGLQILFGFQEECDMEKLLYEMKQISYDCRRLLGTEVAIGIGRSYLDVTKISRSCQESREAIGYRAILGSLLPIYIRDVESVEGELLTFDEKSEQQLLELLKFGGEEKIRQAVEELVDRMEHAKVHSSQCQIYLISIFHTLTKVMQQYKMDTRDIWGGEKDYCDVLTRLMNSQNIQNFLINTCFSIHENISREWTGSMKGIVLNAQDYIRCHYDDPDLSAEEVYKHLHISGTYFSTVFKKETGKTYITWLTDLRLERAEELLLNTDDKTYLIAAKVGYPEPNYFSHVFKKKYGLSPNKYRMKMREENEK